ncbi:MAG: Daunorubicin/doxorubicin resistance ATP-binding protein DrrA [Pseudomonadota bacterium]
MTLRLSDFTFAYSTGHTVLSVPEIQIRRGESVALVGRNGSGKSTLLHALAGLFKAQSGKRTCDVAASEISLVFQAPCLDKKLTVRQNLTLFGRIWGLSAGRIAENLDRLTQLLELEGLLDRDVQTLSGGQQRRADLARAFLCEPKLLLLDEPTSGLDLISQREFWSALQKAKNHLPELTLVCASHHASEMGLFERIVFLEQGRIALDLPCADLVRHLPAETLELSTPDAEGLAKSMREKFHLESTAPSHNKVFIHTESAAQTLAQLRSVPDFDALVDATTIRKTQLSDAVWQRLVGWSKEESGLSTGEAPMRGEAR